ncbi:MAG: tetratricopeptide repeat protein [Phycisphaerales bacterium]
MGPRAAGAAALLALAAFFLVASVQKVWGVDTWWQMAAGRFFLEHRTFPLNDVLSYSAADHEWIEVRWIFCVLMHALWRLGGPAALIAMQVVLLGITWGLMAWRVRPRLPDPAMVAALGVGIAAGLSRWVVRPELFTYCLCAVFLVLLDSEHRKRAALVGLVALQVFWSNAHTLFAMGPVLAWTFVVGEHAERLLLKRRGGGMDWKLIACAAGVTIACLANPYFIRGATFPILLFTQIQEGHIVSRAIGEMASPLSMPLNRWTPDLFAGVGVLVLATLSFLGTRGRQNLSRVLLLLGTAYLATKAQRNVAIFAVIGTWVSLRNLQDAAEHGGWAALRERLAPMAAPAHWLIALSLAAMAWYVGTDRMSVAYGAPRETGLGVVWWNTPRTAVEFLNERKPLGPIFNTIRDGGYISWASAGPDGRPYKVFADGRLEVYGPEHLAALAAVDPATWPQLEAKWGFNTAIVPVHDNEALVGALAQRRDWVLVHLDHRNVVFVRDIPDHQSLIAACRIDLTKPWTPRAPEPSDAPPGGLARAIGAVSRPYFAEGTAEVFLALNATEQALPYLERANKDYPSRARPRAVLAPLYWASGRETDAYGLLAGLDEPTRLAAATEAARLMMKNGNFAGALAPLRLAVALAPADAALRLTLADAAFQAGDFKSARENYAMILRAEPRVNELNKYAFACEQLADNAAAARAYGDSLRLSAQQPAIWNMLGALMAKSGDSAKARECFNEALKLKPDFAAAKKNLEALGPPR